MNKTNLNFKYKFPEDYNPVYSNGVYGGIAPQGEIVLNFYFERQPLPYAETIQLSEDGKPLDGKVTKPENHDLNVIRYVSSGVVLSLESAKSIHDWLGHKIKALEEMERSE